jgi:CubicO group peptidase (beta-lactamase class C family)
MQPAPGFRVGRDTAYAEYAAWHLLARVCENIDGRDYRQQIDTLVIGPFGLGDELVVPATEPEWERIFSRVRINESFRGGDRFPMLLERTAMWGTRWNPAFGAKGCARGLGHFYERLQQLMETREADRWSLRDLSALAHGPAYDQTMGRTCSYSLGFMRDLGSHEFGKMWSENSFGHSGNVGMTAAGVDLDGEFVVAFHLSGLSDGQSAVSYLRPVIMNKISDCLAAIS